MRQEVRIITTLKFVRSHNKIIYLYYGVKRQNDRTEGENQR